MNTLEQRCQMVEAQLITRGISDRRVLQAFRSISHEVFVPDRLVHLA